MLFVCHPKILQKHCLQFLLGVKMAPRGTENNAYAKFWCYKQTAFRSVMVFSGVVNSRGVTRVLSNVRWHFNNFSSLSTVFLSAFFSISASFVLFLVIRTDCVLKNSFFCSFKESAIDTQLDNRHIMLRGDTVRHFMFSCLLILYCFVTSTLIDPRNYNNNLSIG